MQRAREVVRQGQWHGRPADRVTLDETGRHRRRVRLTSEGGLDLLLDLAEATLLRHGDALKLDDGRLVEIRAAAEALHIVRPRDGSAAGLLRLAWHLGNRHQAAAIAGDHLVIRRDHVIKAMLEGLGAIVEDIEAPFDPEGGAYDQGASGPATHGHAHSHDHPHDHGHRHG